MVTRVLVGIALVIACVLTASSCASTGSGPGGPSQKSAPQESASPHSNGDPKGGPSEKSNVITWITGLGISGPVGPERDNREYTYQRLASPEDTCEGSVSQEYPILAAAMDACRAALATQVEDRDALWRKAEQVRDATDRSALDCTDAMAYRLLDALVDAHLAHPELPFKVGQAGGLGQPDCLVAISVSPERPTGGELVTVTGRLLDRAARVEWVDAEGQIHAAPIAEKSAGSLQFQLPEDLTTLSQVVIVWDDHGHETQSWVPLRLNSEEDADSIDSAAPESPGPESPAPESPDPESTDNAPLGGDDSSVTVPPPVPEPPTSDATTGTSDG